MYCRNRRTDLTLSFAPLPLGEPTSTLGSKAPKALPGSASLIAGTKESCRGGKEAFPLYLYENLLIVDDKHFSTRKTKYIANNCVFAQESFLSSRERALAPTILTSKFNNSLN